LKIKTLTTAFLLVVLLIISQLIQAQLPRETEARKIQRMKWWTDARFGMFIHWGLYALPARHEWVKNYERMTNEQYRKYFESFNSERLRMI
jgi:alpha-L-fucosidase